MRRGILVIGVAFGLVGCNAVLGLDERSLDPTVEGAIDAEVDDALDDTSTSTDSNDDSVAPPSDSGASDGAADATTDASTTDTAKTDTAKTDTATLPDTGSDATAGGTLTITVEGIGGDNVNLSAEGALDWAHWGLGTVTAFNHRAIPGGGLIQKGAVIGSPGITALSNKRFVWSDGSPTASASTPDGLVLGTAGEGYTFDVAASSTTTRTLRIYIGWYNKAAGSITATLSDGSAPPVSAMSAGNTNGVDYDRLIVTFRAASGASTLNLRASNSTSGGSLDFFAATLQ